MIPSTQFSRGCPSVRVLRHYSHGRSPNKSPAQLLAELDYLYELGWRRGVFMVDDNFIGNKRNVKLLLKELCGKQNTSIRSGLILKPLLTRPRSRIDGADGGVLMQCFWALKPR